MSSLDKTSAAGFLIRSAIEFLAAIELRVENRGCLVQSHFNLIARLESHADASILDAIYFLIVDLVCGDSVAAGSHSHENYGRKVISAAKRGAASIGTIFS